MDCVWWKGSRRYTPRIVEKTPVTEWLQAWSAGDVEALDELAPLVQHELRQMARRMLAGERAGHGWRPTELINESYIRLLGWRGVRWQNRAHFYAATARMMRRVLIDAARARQSSKRGSGAIAASIDSAQLSTAPPSIDLLALEEALTALASVAARASQVVELRFFGGLSVEETAEALGVSERTVSNDWNTARVWLYQRLRANGDDR
jgi:RNA polymerase sigma factor (TIGR02999 family)